MAGKKKNNCRFEPLLQKQRCFFALFCNDESISFGTIEAKMFPCYSRSEERRVGGEGRGGGGPGG